MSAEWKARDMTRLMGGSVPATTHSFHVGGLEVTTILDGTVVRDAVKPPFCLDLPEDRIQTLAAANHLPADRLEQSFVPTLVNTGDELILFDVGFGAKGPTEGTGLLRARMAQAGYAPEDVDLVVFTHVHPDHILGVSIDGEPTFPNARYAISQVEFDEWTSGARLPETRMVNRQLFLDLIVPLADRMTFLSPGDTVARGITAMAAYGHSPGHMMFMLDDGGKQALLWADLVNHHVFSLQVPDARVAFDDDPEMASATRRRVLDMVSADAIPVIGYHMPFPSVGYITSVEDGYFWEDFHS